MSAPSLPSVEEFKALVRDLIYAYAKAAPHPVGSGPEAITAGEACARAQVRVVEAYATARRARVAEPTTPPLPLDAAARAELAHNARRVSNGLRVIADNMRAEGHGGSRPDVLGEASDVILALLAALHRREEARLDDAFDTGFRRGFIAGYEHAPQPYTITGVCAISREETRKYFAARAHPPIQETDNA